MRWLVVIHIIALVISGSAFATEASLMGPVERRAYNPAPLADTKAANDMYLSVVRLEILSKEGPGSLCSGVIFQTYASGKERVGFVMTSGHCLNKTKSIKVQFFPERGLKPVARWALTWLKHASLPAGDQLIPALAKDTHDIAVIMVDQIPKHVRALPLETNVNPIADVTGTDFFIVTRDHSDSRTLSPLYSLALTSASRFGAGVGLVPMQDSLLFSFDVVPPKDESDRGICGGDSGSPVIGVRNHEALLFGPLAAKANNFATGIGQCGKTATVYNASANRCWVILAMNAILKEKNMGGIGCLNHRDRFLCDEEIKACGTCRKNLSNDHLGCPRT